MKFSNFKIRKVNLIPVLVIVVILIAGYYFIPRFTQQTLGTKSIRFQSPQRLAWNDVTPGDEDYLNYDLRSAQISNQSSIAVSLPLRTSPRSQLLLDELKNFSVETDVRPIIVNGHPGQVASFQKDLSISGAPWNGTVTWIHLDHPYSAVVLKYYRGDGDGSLDEAWSMINRTISW